ncbi:unnamed protein product [Calicophoron daubneyi]|uniref:FMRFamide-activated amiloride-sensitive sodium channel n=1 Tax=Calicophoron daubneyi TaxID=300641 RepID=A0AAV2TAU1_CALDB
MTSNQKRSSAEAVPLTKQHAYLSNSNSRVLCNPSSDPHLPTSDVNGVPITQNTLPLRTQIRKQLKQFGETTTLRGLPRIVGAKDPKRKFMWVFFVVALFFGCITCLIVIINQYLAFDVIHQPKKLYDSPRSFPSVTLCNLRPFSTRDIRALKSAGVLPVDMYFESLKRMIGHVESSHRRYLTMLWTFAAYLSNLPPNVDSSNLGHSLDDIVKRCFILYKSGTLARGTACERSGYWTKTQDRVFHNCYTYTVFENRTNTALNMEMVLYLDNLVEQTDCFDCQERVMASQLTGARLLLHPRASYPRIAEEGINLMPGTMTDIRFSVYEWSMMEPPHGRCSRTTPGWISFNSVNYTYTEEACHAQITQEMIARKCDCLTQDLPIPTELINRDLRKCQAFQFPATYKVMEDPNRTISQYFSHDTIENYTKYAGCAEQISTALDNQKIGCHPACIRYTYKPSITAAQWPTKTFLTWFVTKFLNEISVREKMRMKSFAASTHEQGSAEEMRRLLAPYEEIMNLTKSGRQDIAIQKLMDLQIFERNFLSIIISRPNFDLERVEEKAVVSLASLFSQIGGLLSIWIGLTFICFVELIELVLNLFLSIVHFYKRR